MQNASITDVCADVGPEHERGCLGQSAAGSRRRIYYHPLSEVSLVLTKSRLLKQALVDPFVVAEVGYQK
ncbi:hypothetical protein BN77_p10934 [Rhizobium mesoamericanum STM3625]|uniref:Uncharacterized protein n=1 Tax=Rhizobium mesoamericanum STM3625 TaxID=1211777 RepID=K0Q2B1_9HYPH|nr:hypothetical protein BN77_p10934 [Rhizobium mesoamericanum STM3625]